MVIVTILMGILFLEMADSVFVTQQNATTTHMSTNTCKSVTIPRLTLTENSHSFLHTLF